MGSDEGAVESGGEGACYEMRRRGGELTSILLYQSESRASRLLAYK